MRLKENFFDTNEMKVLESLQDGYKYSNILLKLYLMSLQSDGKLMLNDRIPYNSQMIATITRHSVGDVEKALKIFVELGLIEILESGAIYMLDIQKYIGKSSTEADRQRVYQKKINECKKSNKKSNKKSTPEIELEIDIDIEKDINTICSEQNAHSLEFISLPLNDKTNFSISEEEVNKYQELYPNVDVSQELRNMKGWLDANPTKRKTKRGINRFVNGWLQRKQDSPKQQTKQNDKDWTWF